VESIAFLIAINFDLMRQRGGPLARVIASGGLSRSGWATLLGAAALADPALFGGMRPSQATALPRFEAGQLAPAAHCALESRRTRFESALSH